MKYYSIGKFAEQIGKTPKTIRLWDKQGILKPAHVTTGGTRYYSQEQIDNYCGIKRISPKKIIGYTCSKEEKDKIEMYMLSKGYSFEIFLENDNMKYFDKLSEMICNHEILKIVLYKQNIFGVEGFKLFKSFLKNLNVELEIINQCD